MSMRASELREMSLEEVTGRLDDLQEEIPKCPSCLTPLEKGAKICPVCGYDLRHSKKEITVFECPECGGDVEENARFCSQCGVEFIE